VGSCSQANLWKFGSRSDGLWRTRSLLILVLHVTEYVSNIFFLFLLFLLLLLLFNMCTFTDEKEKVASFWKKHGQSIDHDNYFMSLEQLALADFSVYVCKQREGDFVIVPPEGAHQIVHAV
jgi:hypothetical protein